MSEVKGVIPAPTINVTPLIDVLLVLLIIFMVAAPLKPHRFLAKVPDTPPRRGTKNEAIMMSGIASIGRIESHLCCFRMRMKRRTRRSACG